MRRQVITPPGGALKKQGIFRRVGLQPTIIGSDVSYSNGMISRYIIQWKSIVNGRAGRGTKQFSREEAEQLAQELNLEYPQIHHEAVSVEPPTHPESPVPAPEEFVTVG